jgi:DNA-binding NtrC family response regulator
MTDTDGMGDDDTPRELGFADLGIGAPGGSPAPARAHGENAAAPPADRQAGTPPSVLVIEDDSTLRTVLRRMLEQVGFVVLEARGGRSALMALRGGARVDAVVTDLKMEDGSGGWLLAQLAYEYPRLIERTVVISGDAGGAGAAHIATRWRCPVIPKPFGREDLVGTVARLARLARDDDGTWRSKAG